MLIVVSVFFVVLLVDFSIKLICILLIFLSFSKIVGVRLSLVDLFITIEIESRAHIHFECCAFVIPLSIFTICTTFVLIITLSCLNFRFFPLRQQHNSKFYVLNFFLILFLSCTKFYVEWNKQFIFSSVHTCSICSNNLMNINITFVG